MCYIYYHKNNNTYNSIIAIKAKNIFLRKSIVTARPEPTIARPKHGAAWCSHGTFLQAAVHMEPFSKRLRALQPLEIHYMSRDHSKAHELTNHILHPSPAPGMRSPGAPGNVLRRWCGIVPDLPVSPTGTTGSWPRIL